MKKYLIKRLLVMIPMLLGVTIVSYFVMNLAPGDAASMYLDPETLASDPQALERIREQLGLNQPVYVRYFLWLKELILHGNFGFSYTSRVPVIQEIGDRIGATLVISSLSMVFSIVFGLVIGVFCAKHQYKTSDYIITFLTFIWLSVPNFWFAMLMILLFTTTLRWLPSMGLQSNNLYNPTFLERAWDYIKHLIMPVTALSLSGLGSWARMERSMYLEVMNQDYIRTARSKGISEGRISWKHAFRNSAIPIITRLGGTLPNLIGGAFVIENVFAIPGMGRLGTNAIMGRDYPVVMGVTFFTSILVLVGIFISDVLYAIVDPRIRYS